MNTKNSSNLMKEFKGYKQMGRIGHQKNLFDKLILNESFCKETAALREISTDSALWASKDGKEISLLAAGRVKCPLLRKKCRGENSCEARMRRFINKAKRTGKMASFTCEKNRFGICCPIVQGDRIYGYIIVCNFKNELLYAIMPLFLNFIDTLTRELQKELELAKLYETIRPRAIALSTIHTVHRIISSTLDPDELLPKLARLCLQVLRAEECCIILRNHRRKPLEARTVCKAGKKKHASLTGGAYIKLANREKVLSQGKTFMKKRRLCVPLIDEDIIGSICVANKAGKGPFNEFDREILTTLSEQAAIAIKNAQLYKEQENITLGSIKSLAAILNTRSPGTYRAKESFIKIVLSIGKALELRADDLRNLHYAAILHDAGQIAFPDDLLTKTDKLTGKEYDIIKTHPRKSVSIIRHLGFLKPVLPLILHHHENFDGSGYPDGQRAEEIPLEARIMAVASAFNAMVTKRPYRQRVGLATAVAEIKKNMGTQFDPRVVKAFLKAIKEKEINGLLRKGL